MVWSGETIRHRINNALCTISLLLIVSPASASPTIRCRDIILSPEPHSVDTSIAISCCVEGVSGSINSSLSDLGKEFLQPPSSLAGFNNTQAGVKPLPAVPAAVFMVLSGFVCISLVKDRRAWLAALAGLLWAGQLGIEAVPQLALRIGCRIHRKQQLKTEFTHRYYLDNSSRLRSDIEGTEYIGLLHHLAGIPDFGSVFVNTQPAGIITFSRHLCRVLVKAHSYFNKNTFPSSFANISEQYSSGLLFACLASKVEQFISFSPAFIFERMPRGPPMSA